MLQRQEEVESARWAARKLWMNDSQNQNVYEEQRTFHGADADLQGVTIGLGVTMEDKLDGKWFASAWVYLHGR